MIELVLNAKGQFCKKPEGPGRPWPIEENAVIIDILTETGCSFQEAKEKLELSKQAALSKSKENQADAMRDLIVQIDPFKHLKIIESTKSVVVWEKDNKIEILGSVDVLKGSKLINLMVLLEPELETELMNLAPFLNAKNPGLVSLEDILQVCVNTLKPRSQLPRIKTDDEDIHPAVVEGLETPSLRKIPYKEQKVGFTNLNKYLQDFLTRVDNHKHLCAVLWGQFIGKKWPYICYLYGKEGREGKTSFINMLGNLTKSYGTLVDEGRFALFPLYGKSIIMVPENDKSRLVSNKIVKAITGGALLSIEEKGRTGFSGMIRGTLIVDANVPLKITGRSFETERLLYFNILPNSTPKNKRLSPDVYTKEMGSTPNEFLNYCRQCYEELVTDGGMLSEPSNHHQIMESLSDYVEEYEYEQLIKKLNMEFIPDQSYSKAKLISEAKEKSVKRDFYVTSFMHYLEKNGVKEEGKLLHGVCKKNQRKIEQLDKELSNALPK